MNTRVLFLPVRYMTPLTQVGILPSSLSSTGDSTAGMFLNPTGEGAGSFSLLLGLESAGVIILKKNKRIAASDEKKKEGI